MSEPTQAEIDQALYGSTRRDSKYGVDQSAKGKEDRTWDNIVFDSVHEMKVYRDYVKPNLNAGIFRDLQMQYSYPLHVETPQQFTVKIGAYIADFVVIGLQGETLVLEAKGHQTPLYKRSKKHFEAEYGMRIVEL